MIIMIYDYFYDYWQLFVIILLCYVSVACINGGSGLFFWEYLEKLMLLL